MCLDDNFLHGAQRLRLRRFVIIGTEIGTVRHQQCKGKAVRDNIIHLRRRQFLRQGGAVETVVLHSLSHELLIRHDVFRP